MLQALWWNRKEGLNDREVAASILGHRRNNRRDRGRLVPQLLGWGTNDVLVPQLLVRSFQKARNFTASSHQNAGFSIWLFKKISGGDPFPHPTPSAAFGLARSASARCWDPNLGPPQLFSRGCVPVLGSRALIHNELGHGMLHSFLRTGIVSLTFVFLMFFF